MGRRSTVKFVLSLVFMLGGVIVCGIQGFHWLSTLMELQLEPMDLLLVAAVSTTCVICASVSCLKLLLPAPPVIEEKSTPAIEEAVERENTEKARRVEEARSRATAALSGSTNLSGSVTLPIFAEPGCEWLNFVLQWYYLHSTSSSLIPAWLEALNSEASKLIGMNQNFRLNLKFLELTAGSTPPRITNLKTDICTDDSLSLLAQLDFANLGFEVEVSRESLSVSRAWPCEVVVTSLSADLAADITPAPGNNGQFRVQLRHMGPASSQLDVVPSCEVKDDINFRHVHAFVQACLLRALPRFTLSTASLQIREQEPLTHHSLANQLFGSAPAKPAKPPRVGEQCRLLVKVLSAQLNNCEFARAYCTLRLERPAQRHVSSIVQNSGSPFWDEHFIFELNKLSRDLIIEVCDKTRAAGDELLGEITVYIPQLREDPAAAKASYILLANSNQVVGQVRLTFDFVTWQHEKVMTENDEGISLEPDSPTVRPTEVIGGQKQSVATPPRQLSPEPELRRRGILTRPSADVVPTRPQQRERSSVVKLRRNLGSLQDWTRSHTRSIGTKVTEKFSPSLSSSSGALHPGDNSTPTPVATLVQAAPVSPKSLRRKLVQPFKQLRSRSVDRNNTPTPAPSSGKSRSLSRSVRALVSRWRAERSSNYYPNMSHRFSRDSSSGSLSMPPSPGMYVDDTISSPGSISVTLPSRRRN